MLGETMVTDSIWDNDCYWKKLIMIELVVDDDVAAKLLKIIQQDKVQCECAMVTSLQLQHSY